MVLDYMASNCGSWQREVFIDWRKKKSHIHITKLTIIPFNTLVFHVGEMDKYSDKQNAVDFCE